MSYRVWTEQEALKGSQAAVSQLRGWAYREGRKNRYPTRTEDVIHCGPADDTPLLKADGFTVRLHRDGAAVYSRQGRDSIIDRGDSIEVYQPYDGRAVNTLTAVNMMQWKSGELGKFDGNGLFVATAVGAVAEHNLYQERQISVTDTYQRGDVEKEMGNIQSRKASNAYYEDLAQARYEQRLRDEHRYREEEEHKPTNRGTFKP